MKDQEDEKQIAHFVREQLSKGTILHQPNNKIDVILKRQRDLHRRQDLSQLQRKRHAAINFKADALQHTAQAEQYLQYSRSVIKPNLLHSLRHGKIIWQAGIDLHGLSLNAAQQILQQFLITAEQRQWSCVLIIHGKNRQADDQQPTIKGFVNGWLPHWPATLAFCSALARDGGTGALYLLLKKH